MDDIDMTQHAINWFEIPTIDFQRAVTFYEAILAAPLKPEEFNGQMQMAVFPHNPVDGIGGALVHASHLRPSGSGVLPYLNAGESLNAMLARVEAVDGKITMPAMQLPDDIGFIAQFMDCEGNLIGLHSLNA